MVSNRIKLLREKEGLTQTELGEKLGVIKQTISNWENNISEPNVDTLIKIADIFKVSIDYILARNDIDSEEIKKIFGYEGEDEEAVSFPHKLANQIDFNGTKILDLANYLEVSEKTILEWLSGEDESYTNYYQKLSDYFHVQPRYWTSPRAISPGIEPDMREYFLILLYRQYQKTREFNDTYGSLEDYFPGIKVTCNKEEIDFLAIFKKLDEDSRDIIKGEIKKVLRSQNYEKAISGEKVREAQ